MSKSGEIWSLALSMWRNPGKVGLWPAKKNPGKSCELRMIHFGWFSGVLLYTAHLDHIYIICLVMALQIEYTMQIV